MPIEKIIISTDEKMKLYNGVFKFYFCQMSYEYNWYMLQDIEYFE